VITNREYQSYSIYLKGKKIEDIRERLAKKRGDAVQEGNTNE